MRIGELAGKAGVSAKAIRFYESIGLLAEPERTPAGYRQYTQADAARLSFIKTAQRLGLRLDEIREILALRDHGQPPCNHVRQILRDQAGAIGQRIAELERIRQELAALNAQVRRLTPSGHDCSITGHAAATGQAGATTPPGR